MTEQVVTLRINGENGRLVAVTRESRVELDSLGKTAQQTGQRAAGGARGVDQMGDASERTRRKADNLGRTLGTLKGLFAGYVGLQTVRDLARTADQYSDIVGKLQQVTKNERELASAKAATFRISQQYYQELDATVTLYSRGSTALAQYGVGQAKVAQLTETINAGLLVSRASSAESASAILQLSQALGAGALRGEEFNAVNEAAPRLMQALADSLGRPRGELKKLAEEGKLTIDVLLKAWTGEEARKIAEEASKVPLTIARAWQQLRNEVLRYVGEADQAAGTSGQLAAAIQLIAKSLPLIVSTLATVGKLTAAWFVLYRGVPAIVAGLVAIRNAYVGIAVAQELGIKRSGLWAAASIKGMQGIRTAGVALFAAFAGWEIGKWARENFLQVELFGIAMVNGLLTYFQKLKRETLINFAEIKFGIKSAFEFIGNTVAASYDKLAAGAEKIGLDSVAGKYRDAAAGARQAQTAQAEYEASIASINAEYERQTAHIQTVTGAMADHAIQQHLAKNATDGAAEAADDQALALGGLGGKADEANDKLRELIRAQQEFARENDRIAAQLAGPRAVAGFDYEEGVREANQALAERKATLSEVTEREQLLSEIKRRTLEDLDRESDLVGQVAREYEREVFLSGLNADARRVEEQVLRAADQAREQYNQRLRDTAELLPEEEAAVRRAAAAGEAMIAFNERQRKIADEYRGIWQNAGDSVWNVLRDVASRSIKSASDVWKELKNIFRKGLADIVILFARNSLSNAFGGWLRQLSSGGFAQAGGQATGGGFWSQLFGGVARMFGFGGATAAVADGSYGRGYGVLQPAYGGGGVATGAAVAGMAGYGGVPQYGVVGGYGGGGLDASGYQQIGGFLAKGFVKYAPQIAQYGSAASPYIAGVAGLAGAYYGVTQRGNGGLSSLAAGASYGALAYTGATVATGALVGAAGATAGAGATAAAGGALAGASGAAAAIPVIGWVLAALALVDMVSGGKLFGTKYKLDSSAVELNFGPDGASGVQEITKVRQRSLFRGRKWNTSEQALSDEAQAAVEEVFDNLNNAIETAARQMGIDAPDMVVATFRQEYDKKGKLKGEYGTIAGRRYDEDQETFFERLGLENLLQVAKAVGNAGEIETIAGRYRNTVETLENFTTLALAMQGDVRNATALWPQGEGMLTRTVELIERMAQGGESLAQTYQRLNEAALGYGNFIAGVDQQLRADDLNDYQRAQLEIELQYRDQVKQANDLAKALGLSGARAEDLAKIEQLRALNMAGLQKQMEAQRDTFLEDLSLSDYSTLRDDQKLAESMQLLRDAAGTGDVQRAQQLSQTVLGLGRNLYASGSDYSSLYNQVTAIMEGIGGDNLQGLGEEDLQQIADAMTSLPYDIAREMWALMQGVEAVTAPDPPPVTAPGTGVQIGTGVGGTTGGGSGDAPWRDVMARLDAIAANTGTSAQAAKSSGLRELNSKGQAVSR